MFVLIPCSSLALPDLFLPDAIKFAISHHLVTKIQVFIWKTAGPLPSCGESDTDPAHTRIYLVMIDWRQQRTGFRWIGNISRAPIVVPTLMPSRFEEKSSANVHQEY